MPKDQMKNKANNMPAPYPIRLGILVPSSNTVLEPLTSAIISSLNTHLQKQHQQTSPLPCPIPSSIPAPLVTVHFARIPVTHISLSETSTSQFTPQALAAAASLLADAAVDAIGWSGTSAGWLGFASDVAICDAITAATGLPATTSTLALNKALEATGASMAKGTTTTTTTTTGTGTLALSLGLVTPFAPDVQRRIIDTYAAEGRGVAVVVADACLDITGNRLIADVGEDVLDACVSAVVVGGVRGAVMPLSCVDAAAEGILQAKEDHQHQHQHEQQTLGAVQAVTTFCTNLRAAQRVTVWEREYGIPVYDTVATVLWDMLRMCGADTRGIAGEWGSLFGIE